MATAAWSRLRAPPLHSGATDTLFGLPVHGCHVPDLWLTGSAPSLGESAAPDSGIQTKIRGTIRLSQHTLGALLTREAEDVVGDVMCRFGGAPRLGFATA